MVLGGSGEDVLLIKIGVFVNYLVLMFLESGVYLRWESTIGT